MRQQRAAGLQTLLCLLSAGQIVMIARRLGLWRQAAVEHQQIQRYIAQESLGVRWQADGIGQIGQRVAFCLDQITQRRFGMLQRQRGDMQPTQFNPFEGG
ncbi:hypothetical protein D3C79_905720 [compost metagenome]